MFVQNEIALGGCLTGTISDFNLVYSNQFVGGISIGGTSFLRTDFNFVIRSFGLNCGGLAEVTRARPSYDVSGGSSVGGESIVVFINRCAVKCYKKIEEMLVINPMPNPKGSKILTTTDSQKSLIKKVCKIPNVTSISKDPTGATVVTKTIIQESKKEDSSLNRKLERIKNIEVLHDPNGQYIEEEKEVENEYVC